jgi:subtilisin family serine protease
MPRSAIAAYAASHPDLYSLNNAGTRVDKLHAQRLTGDGVIVAVIDSGIRPGFPILDSDKSVIGGEDFVGDGLGFSNVKNDPHGTFIAGLISGNAEFELSGSLLDAVRTYAPNALDPATKRLPIIGTAPAASIYAIRVFGSEAGLGAPLTTILSAIQRVIDLRRDHARGARGGVNIQVVNLSFGVSTLKAGRTLLDRSVDAVLAAGIVPVVSAGNVGLSSLTIASPGSSMSAVTVGAASFAPNERIGTEVEIGKGAGLRMRPFEGTQTAWFSSRGPNADGRNDPDVVTSGMVNFSQGYCAVAAKACPKEISLASGTSFAAPIASGIAAVLRQAFPRADAVEIRNAMIRSGRSSLIQDDSTRLDRGEGLIDAYGAYFLLQDGVSDDLPDSPRPDEDVRENVEDNTFLRVRNGTVRETVRDLKPGERADILYDVLPGTAQVIVTITSVTPALKSSKQNQEFGDGLFVAIHSAKTSSHGAEGDYIAEGFPREPEAFLMEDPDTGLMRVTITGDWINAGNVSATVTITSVVERLPRITAKGTVRDKETLTIPLSIPSGVDVADFLLSWTKDWSHYPTSDIDLILISPSGKVITTGVSLAGPERVRIEKPKRGAWLMLIDGFDIPAGRDDFQLRVLLDGEVVR